jgi:DNA-directed RNA polymerase subunit omega
MAQVPIEELLKKTGSAYKLVLLAAKRAKELAEGSPALVNTSQHKATSIALDEILAGKVSYKAQEPEEGSTKAGRGGKSEKKRASS